MSIIPRRATPQSIEPGSNAIIEVLADMADVGGRCTPPKEIKTGVGMLVRGSYSPEKRDIVLARGSSRSMARYLAHELQHHSDSINDHPCMRSRRFSSFAARLSTSLGVAADYYILKGNYVAGIIPLLLSTVAIGYYYTDPKEIRARAASRKYGPILEEIVRPYSIGEEVVNRDSLSYRMGRYVASKMVL